MFWVCKLDIPVAQLADVAMWYMAHGYFAYVNETSFYMPRTFSTWGCSPTDWVIFAQTQILYRWSLVFQLWTASCIRLDMQPLQLDWSILSSILDTLGPKDVNTIKRQLLCSCLCSPHFVPNRWTPSYSVLAKYARHFRQTSADVRQRALTLPDILSGRVKCTENIRHKTWYLPVVNWEKCLAGD